MKKDTKAHPVVEQPKQRKAVIIHSPYTWVRGKNASEKKGTGKSLTEPNMAYSVREIMKRSASGMSISGVRVPQYHGDTLVPDFSRLDIHEKHEILSQIKKEIRQKRRDLMEKADKDKLEAIEKAVEDRIRKKAEEEKQSGEASPAKA